jgi:hypothetical protein
VPFYFDPNLTLPPQPRGNPPPVLAVSLSSDERSVTFSHAFAASRESGRRREGSATQRATNTPFDTSGLCMFYIARIRGTQIQPRRIHVATGYSNRLRAGRIAFPWSPDVCVLDSVAQTRVPRPENRHSHRPLGTTSTRVRVRHHSPQIAHAITSSTHPVFRRQPRKNSRILLFLRPGAWVPENQVGGAEVLSAVRCFGLAGEGQ